jgi:hypothetical protein
MSRSGRPLAGSPRFPQSRPRPPRAPPATSSHRGLSRVASVIAVAQMVTAAARHPASAAGAITVPLAMTSPMVTGTKPRRTIRPLAGDPDHHLVQVPSTCSRRHAARPNANRHGTLTRVQARCLARWERSGAGLGDHLDAATHELETNAPPGTTANRWGSPAETRCSLLSLNAG